MELFGKLPERHAAYEDIIDAFYKKIKTGQLKPEDKLPSERDLAEQFGVGRSTIREALKSLTSMGVLEVKPGSGTYVRQLETDRLKKHLQWSFYLNPLPVSELNELRTLLELHTVEKAALSRTEEDLEVMEQSIVKMKETIMNPKLSKTYDLQFHFTVGQASGIKLICDLLELTRYSLEEWFEYVLSDFGASQNTIEEHTSIVKAIRERNPKEAKRLMKEHLSLGRDRLLEALKSQGKESML